VGANATQGATIGYQWFSNTSGINSGGTLLHGEINANFTIPTDLEPGIHYYYVVVSASWISPS
jgi:hypothetical protein